MGRPTQRLTQRRVWFRPALAPGRALLSPPLPLPPLAPPPTPPLTTIPSQNAQGVIVLLTGQSTIERAFMHHLRQELEREYAGSDFNVKVRCSSVDANPLAVV